MVHINGYGDSLLLGLGRVHNIWLLLVVSLLPATLSFVARGIAYPMPVSATAVGPLALPVPSPAQW